MMRRRTIVIGMLCWGIGAAWADPLSGAAATPAANAANVPSPASAAATPPDVGSACRSVGEIVEKIALWRDAGGAASLARAEIARRIDDPAAREVAVSLVAQLYTGPARRMTPAQARQAYAASCALAQESATRDKAPTPAAPGDVASGPTPLPTPLPTPVPAPGRVR